MKTVHRSYGESVGIRTIRSFDYVDMFHTLFVPLNIPGAKLLTSLPSTSGPFVQSQL